MKQNASGGGFFKRHLKLVILVVVVLAGGGFGAYQYLAVRPAAVIDAVKPAFTGYTGAGKATYNRSQARGAIFKILLAKGGIGASDAALIAAGRAPSKYESDVNLANKVADAQTQLASVTIAFSKASGLKNGEHITLKLKAPADLPIQSGTKDVKVSGLKPVTTYTAKQAMGAAPRFLGVAGFGYVKDDKRRAARFDGGEARYLKNGDQVTYRLASSYRRAQRERGRRLKGAAAVTYKVAGLPALKDIADWKQLAEYADSYAHRINSSGDAVQYTLVATKCYAEVMDRERALAAYRYASPDVIKEAPAAASFLTYAVIYKMTAHTVDAALNVPDRITYPAYGRETIPYYDGKLDLAHIDDAKWQQTAAQSEADAIATFKSEHAHAALVTLS
ncbi:hypothetical protein ACFQ3L_08395 [Lacticaseibacillus jixianensis]|uniref:Uncharacterized protein n=1 Tax=Lacticaseibacillus jixianensis TaxID=2486012 RepID=A0ABW4BBC7_9LACO|nr:hypothetical protein [Lacticaseibacillus jixianensis]